MKYKLITKVILLLFISYNINAQIENKKFYIDGNLLFGKENMYEQFGLATSKAFGINPNFGGFIINNLIAGVGLNFMQVKTEGQSTRVIFSEPYGIPSTSSYETTYRIIAPSIFLKYLKQLNKHLVVGAKVNVEYGLGGVNVNRLGNSTDTNYNYEPQYLKATLAPEVQLMFTKNWGLQANLEIFNVIRYPDSSATFWGGETSYTDYQFSLNPSNIKLGVFFYFGDKETNKK